MVNHTTVWLQAALCLTVTAAGGCEFLNDAPSLGLGATQRTGGPQVVWDLEALPLPEIPLPNDQATRLDPSSPTGRRLNVSTRAVTDYESKIRAKFNTYDGFGTYAPISVRFDAPLALGPIRTAFENDDFRDDPFFVLNVDPECTRYGEEVALDMGRGRFPTVLFARGARLPDPEAPDGHLVGGGNIYFPLDPHATANNGVYEEFDEDRDGDGELDPLEDTDFDGRLDHPNFEDPAACAAETPGTPAHDRCVTDHLLTWYERETNSLVLRPLWPLEQRCTYAVVLTDRLVGEGGEPIESPFPGVNPREQTEALGPVPGLLKRYGLGAGNITFAWSFTTGSMTHELEALRAGLYGEGPFARLASLFPAENGWDLWKRRELVLEPSDVDVISRAGGDPDGRVVPGACAGAAFSQFWQLRREWAANLCAIEGDMTALGGVFAGTFDAPNLLVDSEGVGTTAYPSDNDESWSLDAAKGTARLGRSKVTFWCTLPREAESGCSEGNPEGKPFCKPYPVILYSHGYGGSRIEPITSHVGRTAAMGYAMCTLDAYGHGLDVIARAIRGESGPPEGDALLFKLAAGIFRTLGAPDLPLMLTRGRDRDLNNDGQPDSGADMWTADLFHTRDMVRQTVLEYIQFVRLLRSMDGQVRDADGLLGDVDGDGTVDLGGPENVIGMWGISLGGILTGVMAGAEPGLDAASPNAGGGGLVDVALRSSQAGVPDAVMLPMMGQLVGGCLGHDAHQRPVKPGEMSVGDCFRPPGLEGEPSPGGVLRLALYAQDNARARVLEFARIEGVAVGDRIELRNLDNDEVRAGFVNERGQFRIGVPSDAVNAVDRRSRLGLPDTQTTPFELEDPTRFADRLELTVYEGLSARVRAKVDTFQQQVEFQGSVYLAEKPLVALQEGLGFKRNSWEFRRFLGLAQHGIGPADPAVWATRSILEPDLDAPGRRPGGTRVMHMPTAGDPQVPVNTGISAARAAGVLGSWLRDPDRPAEEGWRELFETDARYGMSKDAYLVANHVYEGVGRLQRYADNPVNPNVIFDVDDVSDGKSRWSCGESDWSAINGESGCPPEVIGQEVEFDVPNPEPGKGLRADYARSPDDEGRDGLRVPVLRPAGQHGIYNAQPFRTFDNDAFMVNFTTRYLGTGGRVTRHEAGCDCSASAVPNFTQNGQHLNTVGVLCDETRLRVCDAECAAAWGIRTPAEAACGE